MSCAGAPAVRTIITSESQCVSRADLNLTDEPREPLFHPNARSSIFFSAFSERGRIEQRILAGSDHNRAIPSQQGFDERFELVHASRGLEAFHDIALAVDQAPPHIPSGMLRFNKLSEAREAGCLTKGQPLP